jgi:hypothetical protein
MSPPGAGAADDTDAELLGDCDEEVDESLEPPVEGCDALVESAAPVLLLGEQPPSSAVTVAAATANAHVRFIPIPFSVAAAAGRCVAHPSRASFPLIAAVSRA